MTRLQKVLAAIAALLRDGDVLVNEVLLPDTLPNQTVSEDAALHEALEKEGAERGRFYCWLCAYLSVMVQKDHCEKVNEPLPWWVFLTALANFLIPLWVWLIWHFLAAHRWHA